MDPRDFLLAAHELSAIERPAYRRTVISRACYAVYHVAFDLLHSLGFRLEREHRSHELVRLYLAQSGIDSVIHVGTQLRSLQNLRVRADYWLRDPHPERASVVGIWLQRSNRTITALDAAAADPAARARMTAAIQAWERGRRV